MSFHDLTRYSHEKSDRNLKHTPRHEAPLTVFDLFTRPLADFDIFPSFRDVQRRGPLMPSLPTDDIKVDVKDLGDKYEVTADLVGVKKEDIKLDFEDGVLTIEATHHQNKDRKDESGYIIHERVEGSYSRSFSFDNVDKDGIDAAFENGELVVTLKKAQGNAKKFISIR